MGRQSEQQLQYLENEGYQKVEDAFVDQFLTREGESVADAKERLKRENPVNQTNNNKESECK